MEIVLYKKDARNVIRRWGIEEVEEGVVSIKHGVLNGALSEKLEHIKKGLAGRTLKQQVASRIMSRVNLQKDKGYIEDLEYARNNAPVNTLGMPLPMLAQRYDRVRPPMAFYVQRKYDGNRCLITKKDGVVSAYSRLGKKIKSIDHILEAAKSIPEGTILDGELYHHGTPLQTIRSWIARSQADSERLLYINYDHVSPAPYHQRYEELRKMELANPIVLAHTELLVGSEAAPESLFIRLKTVLQHGYEGLILRAVDGGYEPGKRSKHLIKLKPGHLQDVPLEEEEFLILNIEPSKDGWARLVCGCVGGIFRVSAPGDMSEKYRIMENKNRYLGKKATVQFSNWTPDGKPFHPVAIALRSTYE